MYVPLATQLLPDAQAAVCGVCSYSSKSISQLTDSGLLLLLSHSSKLETLDISHCPLLTGATLQNVTEVLYVLVHV